MEEKEKAKEMSEEEALEMLNELRKKAMEFDGVCPRRLQTVIKKIPKILERSKRIGRAKSETYAKEFGKSELEPFLEELALSLSVLTEKYRETTSVEEYLEIRGDIADFLIEQGGEWYEDAGRYYQAEFLFESQEIKKSPFSIQHEINPESLFYPKSFTIAMIISLKMFNSIMPILKE